jgi:hypothetical protein
MLLLLLFSVVVANRWNPAVEEQAIGRAHRIGQCETVKVYRMFVASTVEQRILKLQVISHLFCVCLYVYVCFLLMPTASLFSQLALQLLLVATRTRWPSARARGGGGGGGGGPA